MTNKESKTKAIAATALTLAVFANIAQICDVIGPVFTPPAGQDETNQILRQIEKHLADVSFTS